MNVRFKRFSGGYEFGNFAGKPQDEIVELRIPERVIIPLAQGSGNEVLPNVQPGENVRAGQIIGIDNDSISNPVHSTVSGLVEEIAKIDYLGKEIQAVAVKSDGTSDWEPLGSQSSAWTELSEEEIEERVYLSGAASLDKEGIPTRYRSSNISPDDVRHIIIRGVESELYDISLNTLLGGENIYHFIEGLKILKKIIPKARFHLALNSYQRGVIKRLFSLIVRYDWIDSFLLEPKYPQEYDEIIVPTILDMQIPSGGSPTSIGAVVLSVQTILHVYEAVVEGKPVIERIVALGGTGFKDNYHVRLRIGTTLDYLTGNRIDPDINTRILLNSPLTGIVLTDPNFPLDRQCSGIIAVPEKTTRQFLSFIRPGFRKDSYSRTFLSRLPVLKKECNTNIHGEERPCISCSFCEEVCPVKIIPHLIYKRVDRNMIDEALINLRIFKCIDCNLCSYVCPSKIPLAKLIKEGKEKLIEEGFRFP